MFTGRLVDGDQVLNTKRGIVFKLFQYREDAHNKMTVRTKSDIDIFVFIFFFF